MTWHLDGHQPGILAAAILLASISTVSTILRWWCRRWTGVGFWFDDWLLLLGQVLSYALCAQLIVGIRYGLSLHRDQFTPEEFESNVSNFLKSLYSVEPFYAACMSVIKLSILLFYWRLFRSVRWMKWGIYITAALVTMWLIAAEVAAIIQCTPISKFWNPEAPGTCLNGLTYFKSITATNLVTDAIVLCLPMPLVWRLNASITRRISLAAGFLIGGFVSLISIIRIEYLNNPHDPDTLYATTKGPIWTAAETSLAVVCANLPILYTLIKTIVAHAFGTVRRRSAHAHTATRYPSRPWYTPPGDSIGPGEDTERFATRGRSIPTQVSQRSHSASEGSDGITYYPEKAHVQAEEKGRR
ncbi:integral membrane protein [Teratosphaeria destructans]|uniref:Integral membrane protein n=1 Tax=Teratosphaeria destructans TaxID=418781 RepID=A0A9W7W3L6_9PEZI|nr:integral membrane protein [Teratosphaeria destructans]